MVAPKRKGRHRSGSKKANATSFKPGQSGNPKGMPKGTKHTKTLIGREWFLDQMSKPAFHATLAAKMLEDPQWAWEWWNGKATQRVEHSGGEDFGARNVSVVLVLHQEIAAMMAEGLVTREVRDRLRGCLPAGDDGDD